MKTDYGKLGQESMDLLRNTSKQAAAVQARLLAEIMRRNCDTAYGKKYGFGEIETAAEFQRKVPLSVYGDYEDYILRMIAGLDKPDSGDIMIRGALCLLLYQFRYDRGGQVSAAYGAGFKHSVHLCGWRSLRHGSGAL